MHVFENMLNSVHSIYRIRLHKTKTRVFWICLMRPWPNGNLFPKALDAAAQLFERICRLFSRPDGCSGYAFGKPLHLPCLSPALAEDDA